MRPVSSHFLNLLTVDPQGFGVERLELVEQKRNKQERMEQERKQQERMEQERMEQERMEQE